ncbi:MAG: arsenate reductase (glutaredoxin) [Bacteroidetes bacterium]|nr:arsenate reductase (glutaredoxin) [Bacteroidota bacterium]
MIIYYNPRCSKCREAKELLEDNKCDFEIRDYLSIPPSKKEIKDLLDKLGVLAYDIIRKKESLFLEKYSDKKYTNTQWIKILSENPILMERPIVVDGEKAVVGRPPVLILDLLNRSKRKK